MRKRTIAVISLIVLMLGLLCGCGDKSSVLTPEEVYEIVLEDAGLSPADVDDIHTHAASYNEVPCYSVHITVDGTEYEYLVAAESGEILYAEGVQ